MADTGTYNIKVDGFDGPLELLLELIEKRKFFINDISLAKIADDYIAYVNEIEQFPVGQTASFLLIASTLVLIKSKSLLPALELTDEEEQSIEELETRLKVYKRIKELSGHFKRLYGAEMSFTREKDLAVVPVFAPDDNLTIEGLRRAVRHVIELLPKRERVPQTIVKKVVRIEDVIEKMAARIQKSLKMSFKQFMQDTSGRSADAPAKKEEARREVIVSFLALLELLKRGAVHVKQEQSFDDISIESKDVGTPEYGAEN